MNCIICGKPIHSLDKQDTCSPVCWLEAFRRERKQVMQEKNNIVTPYSKNINTITSIRVMD